MRTCSQADLVSVVIPVYNGERFLSDAVASVRAQAHRPLEIVVVDDGSTDGTADLRAALGDEVRWLRQHNRGPAAARNAGLRRSRGALLAFLDADDTWPDDKLEHQLSYLRAHPDAPLVLGRVRYVGPLHDCDRRIRFESDERTVMNVNLGSAVFRRSAFERVGLFDESLRNWEDHDWFLRARELGLALPILEQVTLEYRRRPGSLSFGSSWGQARFVHLLKRSLDRRRQLHRGQAPALTRFTARDLARPGEEGPR